MKKKVVIQIEPSYFVASANDISVTGCNHVKDALDVSRWSLDQVFNVLYNLRKVGKTEAKVVEVNA